jgi:hypothetical protein
VGPLSPWHGRLWIEGRPLDTEVAANILNKQSQIADKAWSSRLGLGVGLTSPHCKSLSCYKMFQSTLDLEEEIWT